MKLSKLINYPFGLFGLHVVRKSKLQPVNNSDIEADKKFLSYYERIKPFTLVSIERCYALYQSVNYILKNNIPGDMVECGVWKGGSCMLMALMLKDAVISDRKIFLYDTFEGMTEPGDLDGEEEKKQWEEGRVSETLNTMCYAPLEEVKANLRTTGFPENRIIYIKGKVEDTIPGTMPSSISLLRLDTDWYESTRHELQHLYPMIASKGVLIVDDYGAWQGARKAVDEYFERNNPGVLINRVDYTGRLLVKP